MPHSHHRSGNTPQHAPSAGHHPHRHHPSRAHRKRQHNPHAMIATIAGAAVVVIGVVIVAVVVALDKQDEKLAEIEAEQAKANQTQNERDTDPGDTSPRLSGTRVPEPDRSHITLNNRGVRVPTPGDATLGETADRAPTPTDRTTPSGAAPRQLPTTGKPMDVDPDAVTALAEPVKVGGYFLRPPLNLEPPNPAQSRWVNADGSVEVTFLLKQFAEPPRGRIQGEVGETTEPQRAVLIAGVPFARRVAKDAETVRVSYAGHDPERDGGTTLVLTARASRDPEDWLPVFDAFANSLRPADVEMRPVE